MANRSQTVRAPRGLTVATRKWFTDTCRRWVLDAHHVRLLELAARAFDEARAADKLLASEGMVVSMPSGAKRPHPAIRIRADARLAFARLLRELDLDVDPPAESARPPVLRAFRAGT